MSYGLGLNIVRDPAYRGVDAGNFVELVRVKFVPCRPLPQLPERLHYFPLKGLNAIEGFRFTFERLGLSAIISASLKYFRNKRDDTPKPP